VYYYELGCIKIYISMCGINIQGIPLMLQRRNRRKNWGKINRWKMLIIAKLCCSSKVPQMQPCRKSLFEPGARRNVGQMSQTDPTGSLEKHRLVTRASYSLVTNSKK